MSAEQQVERKLSNPGPDCYDGDPNWTELRQETLERVLTYLGFSSTPEPSLENLNSILKAWSEHFGYDNIAKRIYLGEKQTGAFPIMDPNDFFASGVEHGTGGGCWPSGEAAFGLLRRLGFNAERVAGTMMVVGDPMFPAHGGLNVHFDDRTFRVEPSLGAAAALELIEGQATSHDNETYGLWQNGDCNVWWRPGHSRTPIETTISLRNLSSAFFYYRNEATKQFSVFNSSIYIRRTIDECSVTYARGKLITVDQQGELSATEVDVASLKTMLVDTFKLSEEIVDRLPADEAGAQFDA